MRILLIKTTLTKVKADFAGQSNDLCSAERDRRRQIFLDNVALIRAANDLFDRGLTNYQLRVNRFADRT